MDPTVGRARLIVESYVAKGDFKQALAELQEWRRSNDGPWISATEAYVYGQAGEPLKSQSTDHRPAQ
jgi:hypothetical protein